MNRHAVQGWVFSADARLVPHVLPRRVKHTNRALDGAS